MSSPPNSVEGCGTAMVTRRSSKEKPGKQSRVRLTESKELAQALMRSAGTGIYIVQDGKFQYVNSLFLEETGYTEEELLGTHSLDLVHPEDRETVREKAIENLKKQASYLYEYRFIKKDGDILWVLEGVTSTEYRGKQATVGSFMDVTERKKMEEALQFSDAAFKSIQEGVIATDTEYTITRWNEVSERIYGIKASEAIGKRLFEVIEIVDTSPGETAKQFKQGETQGYYQCEQFHRTKCAEAWVSVSVQAVEGNGKRYGWVTLATDITERRKAEEGGGRTQVSKEVFSGSV